MKTLYTYILIGILGFISALNLNAQQIGDLKGINFQAVAIDEDGKEIVGMDEEGKPLYESNLEVRFTITTGQDGNVLYQETHETVTDAYGHFSLVIGQGNYTSGDYTALLDIPWIEADQWLQVELKYNGNDYRLVSNQQFMSVPYSFYTDDIADDAITTSKILNEEILSEDISNGTIVNEDLADDAVTTQKILNGEVVNEDIANGTIDLTSKVNNQLGVQNGGTGLDAAGVTDGQLLIGDGANSDFQLANIIAGRGIIVTNTAGGIEIESGVQGVDTQDTDVVNVGNIQAGDTFVQQVTLNGVAPGDFVVASYDSPLQGCQLSAYVRNNNQIEVAIFNGNANQKNLGSGIFKVLVIQ